MGFLKKFLDSLEKAWLVRLFVSRRFVAVIISLLIFFSLLGMIIPQAATSPTTFFQNWQKSYPTLASASLKLGLTNLFYTWWFLLLLFIVFLSMFFCTILRLKPVKNRRLVLKKDKPRLTLKHRPLIVDLRWYFLSRLYFFSFEDEEEELFVQAWRGGARFFSILFHLGMMIALLASVVDKSSGLSGKMLLTEGQTLVENHFNYVELKEAPLFNENHHFFQVHLEKADVKYRGNTLTDVAAWLEVVDNDFRKKKKVLVNYPLNYKGFSFLLDDSGFSPFLSILAQTKKPIFASFVSLGKKNNQSFSDFINFNGSRLKIELYSNTIEPIKKHLVDEPLLELTLLKGKEVAWQGKLKYGESITSPVGEVSFNDLRRWVSFRVTFSAALNFIFLGLLLASLGIAGRLLFLPRQVSVWVKPKGRKWQVFLKGRARFGKVFLAKELDKLENFLKERYN